MWSIGRDPLIRPLLILFAAVVGAISAIDVVEVFFIRQTLHSSTTMFGLITAMWLVGVLIGAAFFGRRNPDDARLARWMLGLLTGTVVVVGLAGTVPGALWLLPLWIIGGVTNGGENVGLGVLLGRRVPSAMRGHANAVVMGTMNAAIALGYVGRRSAAVGRRHARDHPGNERPGPRADSSVRRSAPAGRKGRAGSSDATGDRQPVAVVDFCYVDAFLGAAFFGAAFFTALVEDVVFFAVAADVFFAPVFLAAVFFAAVDAAVVAFLAGAFFAAAFVPEALAGARLAAFFGAGPAARFSDSMSDASSIVIVSGVWPRRSDAFDSPSVTYGPKRPSLMTTGFSVSGSTPRSRSGGLAAARPRSFGAASSASASSSVTVNSWSSLASDRVSSPRLMYGP